ncbi:hypothetical protein SAPIO_CDS9487 [Scedosporium apiospermum]|uniref:Uncharacterized protein n=1 Tax=Pseudallescheria apiosperma TaxID=563466 RepID=A0A084FWW9_PSEDA|nr:uncharacterized protein SAPIO_CDS9487 [Scedosporium apiospermum]KEZ39581.1 hypothetical protein SAPIO_CDS9487 [Scedosporium apiospermum]
MSLSKFIKKTRPSTKSILGQDYPEEVIDNPPVPTPQRDIEGYTDGRLRRGLVFADTTLRNKRRKVSPLTEHCLLMYTATIKAVLEEDFDDNDERNMLLSTVLMCERDIYTKNFLRGPDGEEQASLIERLAELRRYEFAARYGDYMSHVCQKLKTTAKVYKTEYYESLHGWDRYWTDINHSINIEQTNWTRRTLRDPTVTDDDVKTTLTIYNACEHMAIDFDKILQVIAMYTDRNSLVHASILSHVSTRLLKRPLSPTEKEARVGTYKRQKKAWNALEIPIDPIFKAHDELWKDAGTQTRPLGPSILPAYCAIDSEIPYRMRQRILETYQ